MQNQDGHQVESEVENAAPIKKSSEIDDWASFRDDDIMQQHNAIQAEEAVKIPFVGDKEPLSSLSTEYKSGNPILLEKIKVLTEEYAAIRRTRGDGNCFFRSFMFAYLEHILESQDRAEVDRIKVHVENCRKTLLSLGYAEFTFEDFFSLFLEQIESVLSGNEASISHDELVQRSRDQSVSDYVVMFFRFITSGEIRKRSEFYEPFIQGLTNTSVEQFCKSSVEPMGEESDHVHITALSDTLGVPIRIVYLDRSCDDKGSVSVNHHDFTPVDHDLTKSNAAGSPAPAAAKPFITLLYRPGKESIGSFAKMILDDWKRLYSNMSKTNFREVAVKRFWDMYDPKGYSLWFCDYKYNDENIVSFVTMNKVGGFLLRMDLACKYAFGKMLVLSRLFRGTKIPQFVLDKCYERASQMIEGAEPFEGEPASSEE